MSRASLTLAPVVVAAALLAGCGERPQTAGARKSDSGPYASMTETHRAPGTWNAGDAAAWERQINARAMNQNEYLRTGTRAGGANAGSSAVDIRSVATVAATSGASAPAAAALPMPAAAPMPAASAASR